MGAPQAFTARVRFEADGASGWGFEANVNSAMALSHSANALTSRHEGAPPYLLLTATNCYSLRVARRASPVACGAGERRQGGPIVRGIARGHARHYAGPSSRARRARAHAAAPCHVELQSRPRPWCRREAHTFPMYTGTDASVLSSHCRVCGVRIFVLGVGVDDWKPILAEVSQLRRR